eukprot:s713_g13.t1
MLMLFGGLVLMNLVLAILRYSFGMQYKRTRLQTPYGGYCKRMDPPPVITEDIQVLPLHALVSSVQDLEDMLTARAGRD